MQSSGADQAPARFVEALESVRAAALAARGRMRIELEEIPAPVRLAPFALALEARAPDPADPGREAASGSAVVLHEPGGHPVWEGDFRFVTVAKAQVETELGGDPFLAEVAWSYLAEALETESLPFSVLAGTVTRTVSEFFGTLSSRPLAVGVEVRASWTPDGPDLGPQLVAWLRFLGKLGGVEPLPPGVAPLRLGAPASGGA
jgi:hypothetical protein